MDEEGTEHVSEAPARQRVRDGRVRPAAGGNAMNYSNTLNDKFYIVENPDVLVPAEGSDAQRFLTFSDTSKGAGFTHKVGKGRIDVISVPIESITDRDDRDRLVKSLFNTRR